MALGTKRPGDFVEPDESGQQPVVPTPTTRTRPK